METIIVEIFIPAISSSFDFRLPAVGRVADIINEITYILTTTQQNLEFDDTYPMLCDLKSGVVLDPALFIAETGIRDGSQLMLV